MIDADRPENLLVLLALMRKADAKLRNKIPRGDLSSHVYDALREGIVDGSVHPGQRLIELDICQWLNVSRTPTRDALRRLQSDGLVEAAPGGGLKVARYDVNALHELYLVREVLEGSAAGEAARSASSAEILGLRSSVEQLQDLLHSDIESFANENRNFHEQVYAAAHNRFLIRTLKSLADSLLLLGPTAINTPEWRKHSIAQHSEITEAIAKRDAGAAEQAMRQHMRDGFARRLELLKHGAATASKPGLT